MFEVSVYETPKQEVDSVFRRLFVKPMIKHCHLPYGEVHEKTLNRASGE